MNLLKIVPKFARPAAKVILASAEKNMPTILIAAGVVGMGVAVYEGSKAAIIFKENSENMPNGSDRLDKIKLGVKVYAKTGIIFSASAASILFGHKVTLKRLAFATAAYQLVENNFGEYKEAAKREFGIKGEESIRDNVGREYARNVESLRPVIDTGRGNTLFIDPITKRAFKSSINDIQRAVNVINRATNNHIDATLNDFEYEIGIPMSGIGKTLCWREDEDNLEIRFIADKTPDGLDSCLVLEYDPAPKLSLDGSYDDSYAKA